MSTRRITLGEVRLCYVHLDEPWTPVAGSTEKGKYSITALIPKSNQELVQTITNTIKETYNDGVSSIWEGKTPPDGYWHNPLQDGDSLKRNGLTRGHEFEGHLFLTAKSLNKPEIYGSDRSIQDSNIIYPGCYGWLSISIKPYIVGGNMGISVFLNAVMKTRDGQNLTVESDQLGCGMNKDFAEVPIPQQGENKDISESSKKSEVSSQQAVHTTLDLSSLDRRDLEEMLKRLMALK